MTSGTHTKGSKYEATRELDIKAIAKLVRGDIAAAIADGDLPAGSSASVRIERYSGGQSINVTLAIPGPFRRTPEQTEASRARGLLKPWLSRSAFAAEGVVEAILAAYNFDRSDSQSDYFHVRFFSHINLVAAREALQVAS
jgi:hypothetical protein